MLLTYVVYAILIGLVIWGIKFPGFTDKFNDDFLDKNSTKAISGLAAIFIILHHISQKPAFQDVTHELFFFNDLGYLICTIFFFFSGYGLTVSADNNENYLKTFFKKRFVTILVPFFLCNLVFAIVQGISGMPLVRVLLGVFGLVNINPNGWFPFVLMYFYLIFYLVRKNIKNKNIHILIYVLATFVLVGIFAVNGHFAWWGDPKKGWWLIEGFDDKPWWMQQQVFWLSGEWWVNSGIGFGFGAFFATYKDKLVNWLKKFYWLKLAISAVAFGLSYKWFLGVRSEYQVWSESWEMDPGIFNKFVTTSANELISLLFIVFFVVLLMKFRSENPVTRFMGKISFETYLYGYLWLEFNSFIVSHYDAPIIKQPFNYNLALYAFIVLAESILAGFIFNKLGNVIIKKIKK